MVVSGKGLSVANRTLASKYHAVRKCSICVFVFCIDYVPNGFEEPIQEYMYCTSHYLLA